MRNPFAALTLALALLSAAPCRAADVVRWGVADNPPFHILSGPRAGTGYSDIVRRFFIEKMPEYEHETVRVTLARLMEAAREGLDYCYCNLRKTPEREALFHYSDVTAVSLGPRLYVRPDSPILSQAEDGAVSLGELLDLDRYTGVAEQGRAFGPEIRSLFEAHGSSVRQLVCPDTARKYDLVADGRTDFFLEFPFVLQNYVKNEGKKGNLVPLKIKEQSPYVFSYVVCTRTGHGKRVIDRINQVLRAAKGTPEHRALFNTPAGDLGEAGKREYESLYEIFLKAE